MKSDQLGAQRRQRRIAVVSTFIGATIEWYDFFIFGVLSALFLNKLFFPTFDPTTGTILGFMTFATAWIVRPLGGVIAGHLGDKIGRKTILLWSFLIMGIATTMIGLLPTYETAGALGAVLLVLLRIVQGLSVGAEYGGAIVTVVEHADKSRRGLLGSLPQCGAFFGLLLGNATFLLLLNIDHAFMMEWGWRIPFLLSALMLGIGAFIRTKMHESPEFEKVKQSGAIEGAPFFTVMRQHTRQVISIMFAQAAPNTFFYACSVALVSYAVNTLGISQSKMLAAVCLGAFVEMCMIPVFGALSDRVERRKVYIGGLLVMALTAYPFFVALQAGAFGWLLVCYVVMFGFGHAACHSSQAALFSEMFPTTVRYTGISVGYQASGAIFAGPLPALATVLIAAQWGSLWVFLGYILLIATLSMIAISGVRPYDEVSEPAAPRSTTAPV